MCGVFWFVVVYCFRTDGLTSPFLVLFILEEPEPEVERELVTLLG